MIAICHLADCGMCYDPSDDLGHDEHLMALLNPADELDDADAADDSSPNVQSVLNAMDDDERLYKCFLFALKQKVKRIELPILIENFYRNYVQACW